MKGIYMKKGITLTTLVIMIAIILIISTTTVVSSVNILNTSKLLKFGTEISYIQSIVDSYSEKNNGELPISDIVRVDISNVNVDDLEQFNGEDIIDDNIILNKFDNSLFEGIDLLYGNEKKSDKTDIYAISLKTKRVYYVKGIKVLNKVYFTLTEDLMSKIRYTNNKNSLYNDDIIFESSNTNWTNKIIVTNIKVPSSYTDVSVSVNNENIELNNVSDGYNIYIVDTITGNYSVNVDYTKNNNAFSKKYYVNKFDNEAPIILISDIKNLVSQDLEKTLISIESTDNLSGIKSLKYETEKIKEGNISSYFKNSGIDIKNDVITLSKNVSQITIYAEDNAGNVAFLYQVLN